MFDIKGLRTFAMSAKDLDKSVEFYTKTLGGQIVKKVEPTEEQKKAGQVKEVDVRLGNFEVHLFDASIKPREVDPHHTLKFPGRKKRRRFRRCKTSVPISKKSGRTATAIIIRSMSSIPTATAGNCRS